jgi:phosphotriesterase-related protein
MIKPAVIFMVLAISVASCTNEKPTAYIMTVNGPLSTEKTGIWLTHEHVLVDFIGADSVSPSRYDRQKVISRILPYLRQVRDLGCRTFVECTPEYLGKDPLLLKALSDSTGMNILTNTGFYGAHNNKFIPAFAFNESAEQLSQRWISEWKNGIGDTGIKPGFIKIAVDPDSLSPFHKKLVRAAALTHLETGLTIASHTGPAIPAFQELEVLEQEGVAPSAFIWVHANLEKDLSKLVEAASRGAWISLDKLDDNDVGEILSAIMYLKDHNLLNKVLLSHDAGWYDPARENGGNIRGYTTLFEKLIPAMQKANLTRGEINQLLEINPVLAFTVRIRKL